MNKEKFIPLDSAYDFISKDLNGRIKRKLNIGKNFDFKFDIIYSLHFWKKFYCYAMDFTDFRKSHYKFEESINETIRNIEHVQHIFLKVVDCNVKIENDCCIKGPILNCYFYCQAYQRLEPEYFI